MISINNRHNIVTFPLVSFISLNTSRHPSLPLSFYPGFQHAELSNPGGEGGYVYISLPLSGSFTLISNRIKTYLLGNFDSICMCEVKVGERPYESVSHARLHCTLISLSPT